MKPTMNTGMRVAAFFDIDGTLLGPPSLERRLLRYLRWRGALTAAHGARWLGRFLQRACRGLRSPEEMSGSAWLAATNGNKAHLAGIRASTVEAFAASLGRRGLGFLPQALQRLEWHAAQGHEIFLVSGTLAPLADVAARQLPLTASACATRLEADGDVFTGEVAGEAMCGPEKARAVERLAAQYGLDLGRSYAYGDSWTDCWMLESVGNPAAVNRSARLARLARHRGWPVLVWHAAKLPHRSENAETEWRKRRSAQEHPADLRGSRQQERRK